MVRRMPSLRCSLLCAVLALLPPLSCGVLHDLSNPSRFNVVCCAMSASAAPTSPLDASALTRRRFSAIYESAHWTGAGGGSGEGSDPAAAAGAARIVGDVLRRVGAAALVDIGCGSLSWLATVIDAHDAAAQGGPRGSALRFVGVDVVPALIDAHRARLAESRPQWSFAAGDAAAPGSLAPLLAPARGAGPLLLLCRDALQHLLLALAARALENMARSGARLLLLGSYRVGGFNCDMPTAGFFSWVSLLKSPFLLPRPLAVFEEGHEAKQLLLFDGDALRALDWAAMRARAEAHTRSDAFREGLGASACGAPPAPLPEDSLGGAEGSVEAET
jgi:hypothetical protein